MFYALITRGLLDQLVNSFSEATDSIAITTMNFAFLKKNKQ